MSRTEIADTLAALHRLRHRVTALELRILHRAEVHDLGTETGAADTASWWANQTRQTKRDAKRRLELAHALDDDHEPVRDAMAAGAVSEEQAAVIVKGVDALPVEHRRKAEAHLIGLAAAHDPVALRRLAHHVLEVVAPEIAEDHELKALQRQEALAEEACRFTIADDGHGLCHGRFTLPSHVGAMLKQAVLAINSPKHRHHSGTPKGLGHAFCEYVTRYPVDRLPQAGGVDATVVVTMTLENLLGDSQTPAAVGHRGPDHRRPSPQAGLRGRDHPDRARRRRPRSSTSDARTGSTTSSTSGSRSGTATSTAPPSAATGPPRCATSTTTSPGPGAARPPSTTDACSAPATTPTPTHPSTR